MKKEQCNCLFENFLKCTWQHVSINKTLHVHKPNFNPGETSMLSEGVKSVFPRITREQSIHKLRALEVFEPSTSPREPSRHTCPRCAKIQIHGDEMRCQNHKQAIIKLLNIRGLKKRKLADSYQQSYQKHIGLFHCIAICFLNSSDHNHTFAIYNSSLGCECFRLGICFQ